MTDNFPTTSETILASAHGETDPKALSMAADTIAPGGADPSIPAYHLDESGKLSPIGSAPEKVVAEHTSRLDKLEADLAHLRKLFGWPEHSA